MVNTDTGGVKPMAIAGRLVRERERLIGMTNEERAWRKKWVQDQHLSPNEPRYVPELYKSLYNPIRRLYRAPLDIAAKIFEPTLGKRVHTIRYITGKFLMGYAAAVILCYYFKYNANDWTRGGGWRVLQSRQSNLPGDLNFPEVSVKKPSDYGSRGFNKVTMNLNSFKFL
ncbi:hypothetical protein FQA39_LY13944 [Lamprigera yunnana]|nr:hypothetical protein FQA39_LY13944 [Lamprigera yunnana]